MRMVGQSRPEWSGTRGCRYHRRMKSTPTAPERAGDDAGHGLPLDAQSILELAARSMFHVFSSISQGMFLIDRTGRIVWVNEGYQRFLPALGLSSVEQFVGRTVEEVIPNTQMRQVLESGEAILVDLLTNRAGTFVVSRIPLRDEAGAVIGAIGIVLFDQPETTLKPLIAKFARMQRDLDDARRELETQRVIQGAGRRPSKYTFANFVGASPAAIEVKRQARRAAQSSSPVLLLGETGTGKELLAHAVHAALLEAEFFGVAPGAYTGADRKGRDGKFKLADGGTLFLDEIGDMPLPLQAKLLRALQEGEIEPLGSNRLVPFDARLIAATSHDLAKLVRAGRFREDLYYRLNVLPIRVPPLRERRANILAQAALRSDSARIDAPHLELVLRDAGVEPIAPSADLHAAAPAGDAATMRPPRPLSEQITELEREAIAAALAACGGNKLAAARMLGISRATLYGRLNQTV